MKLYFNYAENYIKNLEGLDEPNLMFTQKALDDKQVNITSYLFKHFPKKRISYIIKHDTYLMLDGKKVPICSELNDLERLQEQYDYVALDIPTKDTEKFLTLAFARKKSKYHGLGIYSMNVLQNFPFDSADTNPTFSVVKFHEIIFPNGKKMGTRKYHELTKMTKFLALLGYEVKDIYKATNKKLVEFNIKSYLYSASLGDELKRGKMPKIELPKLKSNQSKEYLQKKEKGATVPAVLEKTKKERALKVRETAALKTGMQICDNCAIKETCPDFLANSVCNRSNEFKVLAEKFKTRDINMLEGSMSDILGIQSERYMRGVAFEKASGGFLDKSVTDLENSFFKNVDAFLKVLKPSLQQTGGTYNMANQQVNIALAMKELDDAGFSAKDREKLSRKIGQVLGGSGTEATGDNPVATEKS